MAWLSNHSGHAWQVCHALRFSFSEPLTVYSDESKNLFELVFNFPEFRTKLKKVCKELDFYHNIISLNIFKFSAWYSTKQCGK